jgi:hypothetical protein
MADVLTITLRLTTNVEVGQLQMKGTAGFGTGLVMTDPGAHASRLQSEWLAPRKKGAVQIQKLPFCAGTPRLPQVAVVQKAPVNAVWAQLQHV